MQKKILLLLLFFLGRLFLSQNIERIEFESSISSVFGNEVFIVIGLIKNNKKGKARIRGRHKDNFFSKRISQKEYVNICNSILNIKDKMYANTKDSIKTRCLDGAFTDITIFQNNTKKKYFLDCISAEDKIDEERKNFWHTAKLILETVRMKIEDLY